MITLGNLKRAVGAVALFGNPEVVVSGVTNDSRSVRPGDMYAALRGESVDGAKFIPQAVAAGAVAVFSDRELDAPVPVLQVVDARASLGPVAAACYGNPSDAMQVVGITGTNGKTTITYLLEAALQGGGKECGVMGTIEYRFGDQVWDASHTTPEAPVIQSILRQMHEAGANAVVMETSSHGLALGRLGGTAFDVVAFTNLTQDHLDFHRTMEEYAAAKMKLFTDVIATRPNARIVVNDDDSFSKEIRAKAVHPVQGISCRPGSGADFRPAVEPTYRIEGIDIEIITPEGPQRLRSSLTGPHNLNNLLVATAIAFSAGVPVGVSLAAFDNVPNVPGRLERIHNPGGCTIFVDYAHTPDALERVLAALAPLTPGRLICVFGCGGDRDTDKRSLMGAAVARGADVAVVTSDNPRTEEPAAIIRMVEAGVLEAGGTHTSIVDRAEAIRHAIAIATPEDTVLIAGKGHEDYVIVGTQKTHFDDREQARLALAQKESGSNE